MGRNQIATMGLRLCYVLLAARLLAAQDYGLLVYAQSWYIAIMPLALLGVSIQFGRRIGADRASGLDFAAATRGWRLVVAVAAAAAVTLLAGAVEPLPTQAVAIGVFALALVPRVMGLGSEAVLTGLERADRTCANNLTWRAAELAAAVPIMLAGGGILALAAVHFASWLLQAVTGYARERRLAAWPAGTARTWSETAAKALFRDGLPIALAATVNGLLISGLLILFRLLHGAEAQLGVIALFLQIVGLLLGVAVAIGNAVLPHFARRGRKPDDPLPTLLLDLGLMVSTLGAALCLVVPAAWLPAALGAGFAPMAGWLPLLPLFGGLILAETLLARLLVVHGGVGRLLPIAAAGAGLAYVMAPVLIHFLDGAGVLITALFGYGVQTLLTALAVAKALVLRRRALLVPGLLLSLTAAITALSLAAWLDRAWAASALLVIGLAAAIWTSVRAGGGSRDRPSPPPGVGAG